MIHVELSIVTLIILYYSSRLVLFLHLWQSENEEEFHNLTAQNMLYYFIPGTIEYDLIVEYLKDNDDCLMICGHVCGNEFIWPMDGESMFCQGNVIARVGFLARGPNAYRARQK